MPRYEQTGENTSFAPPAHLNPRALWAIQIGTIDSLRWNGFSRLSNFLGRHSVEHSFTRMAKVWCGENGQPLTDPETGKLYSPIFVRGELNPGATDPRTGDWQPLRIDRNTVSDVLSSVMPRRLADGFSQAAFRSQHDLPRSRIQIFSQYGEVGLWPFEADHIIEQPVAVGSQETIEALWNVYLQRALDINAQSIEYNLVSRNCHTVNAALNAPHNTDSVRDFAQRGLLKLGANPAAINVPEASLPVIRDMDDLIIANFGLHNRLYSEMEARVQSHVDSRASEKPNEPGIFALS